MNERWIYFGVGALAGLSMLSFSLAAVPGHGMITDDTAIYQRLSEIRVPREKRPNFDKDIAWLNKMEPRYREKLPLLQRLRGPIQRIARRKYRYTGTRE